MSDKKLLQELSDEELDQVAGGSEGNNNNHLCDVDGCDAIIFGYAKTTYTIRGSHRELCSKHQAEFDQHCKDQYRAYASRNLATPPFQNIADWWHVKFTGE